MALIRNAPELNPTATSTSLGSLTACSTVPALPEIQREPSLEGLLALLRVTETHNPGHGDRTANYAVVLGAAAGMPENDLLDLRLAALLHDLGKLVLPDEILEKEGPLTAEEYGLMQSHPRAAAELLRPIPSLRVPAVLIAHHHERWDGAGYPYGVRGPLIPHGSRILAVADTFDALTSDRPYHRARDPGSALRLLQAVAGSQLDPELVTMFVGLIAKFLEPAA